MVKMLQLFSVMTVIAAGDDSVALLQQMLRVRQSVGNRILAALAEGGEDTICVEAAIGDIAPVPGSFTASMSQQSIEVVAGTAAEESGSFCVPRQDVLLLQRTNGLHTANDIEAALSAKKTKTKTTKTTTTTTTSAVPPTADNFGFFDFAGDTNKKVMVKQCPDKSSTLTQTMEATVSSKGNKASTNLNADQVRVCACRNFLNDTLSTSFNKDTEPTQATPGLPADFFYGLLNAYDPGVKLGAYPGYAGDLKVTGEVNAYLSQTGTAYVTYDLKGLEDACKTTPAGVGNACGIHIHAGKTCADASAVGGHYYDTASISSDPWSPLGYNSRYGRARGNVKAAIGKGEDIAGRAMVVHDSTGARVACATLPSKLTTRPGQLLPYPGYAGDLDVTGYVNAYMSWLTSDINVYVTYDLKGLEDACKTTPEGVGNACGIHIHEGKTCDDASAVGGHYYDSASISSDPWAPLGYNSRYGRARGNVKAAIGKGADIAGRAMVVHDSTGGRVACALLPSKLEVMDETLMV